MASLTKALIFGFLIWLIPFITAIPFYSKDGQPIIDIFLFKSIMIIVGSVTGAVFLVLYFRQVSRNYFREGVLIGLIWLAINWTLDLIILVPLAKIDVGTYFARIGLRYLFIPVFAIAFGLALRFRDDRR